MLLGPPLFKEHHVEGVHIVSLIDVHNIHTPVDLLKGSLHSATLLFHRCFHVFLSLSLQLLPLLFLELPMSK